MNPDQSDATSPLDLVAALIRAETKILHLKSADAVKAAAALDERRRELNECEVALINARAEVKEARQVKEEAAATLCDLDKRKRELDAREAIVASRERDLNSQEAVYRARQQAFDARQRELDDRQKQLEEAEADYKGRTKYIAGFLEAKQDSAELTWRSFTLPNTPP